ncbi:MAG: YdeI/OmpD-associated family protein, partial [Anaerolineales bacterium]|nr:YdeI/OmpD-associated family protein [Anaerolineales bacterium]
RDAGVEVGDRVTIEVRYDDTPRIVPAPKMFTETLSKNKPARDAFQKLPASRQKEILQYLNSLKRPETLERNIEKIIRILQSKM